MLNFTRDSNIWDLRSIYIFRIVIPYFHTHDSSKILIDFITGWFPWWLFRSFDRQERGVTENFIFHHYYNIYSVSGIKIIFLLVRRCSRREHGMICSILFEFDKNGARKNVMILWLNLYYYLVCDFFQIHSLVFDFGKAILFLFDPFTKSSCQHSNVLMRLAVELIDI